MSRFLSLLVLAGLLLGSAAAQAPDEIHSTVVVDSNPAIFAVLAALNAAGYDSGADANSGVRGQLRAQMRAQLQAHPAPVLAELKSFYQTHRLADPNQDLNQYVTLALFLGNPPGLTLTVPPAGLPPAAAAVDDIVPLLQRFYTEADLDALWQSAQPQYDVALARDAALIRRTLATVDTFFRFPQTDSPRQFFVFPDAFISAGQSDSLNYEANYYLTTALDLTPQMAQVRHTYLHFVLDPIIGQFPAVMVQVEQLILPLVARAPALEVQFKRDPQLLYTECLVRAVEIQLDPGTVEQKQAEVDAAMSQGLVLTSYWFGQLTAFRADPENFSEFYPVAAFAVRYPDLAGEIKHMTFAAAPASSQPAVVQPVRVLGLLDQGQGRLDAHDFAAAAALAHAALAQPHGDHASAYFLLGKIAAGQNQPAEAVTDFQQALAQAAPTDVHVRTWANIYLARLFDAGKDRATAIRHYKAALLTADTESSKSIAEAGIKAPFLPPAAAH